MIDHLSPMDESDPDSALVLQKLINYNARLLDTRKRKRYSQKDVADLVGMSPAKYSEIERLHQNPTPEEMGEISDALGLTPEYLFPHLLLDAVESGVTRTRTRTLTYNRLLAGRPGEQRLLTVPVNPEEEYTKNELKREEIRAIETLRPTYQTVIKMMYGLQDSHCYTLKEVARVLKVSIERVRQIKMKALRELRHPDRSRKLKSFVYG